MAYPRDEVWIRVDDGDDDDLSRMFLELGEGGAVFSPVHVLSFLLFILSCNFKHESTRSSYQQRALT